MPIIEQVSPDLPLSQGDILKGIKLFKTTKSWTANGGESIVVNQQLCLVISRPCVAQHKEQITAVSVKKYEGKVPDDVKSFEDVVAFLRDTRDAADSPDVFYIGEVPDRQGRYQARLDSIHNVDLPSDPAERALFVKECRVGRIHLDFARDLHSRLFRAFATLGFDDYGWFTDADLNWLIEKGNAEIAAAQARVQEIEASRAQKGFSGGELSVKTVDEAKSVLKKAENQLAPYEVEKAKREKK